MGTQASQPPQAQGHPTDSSSPLPTLHLEGKPLRQSGSPNLSSNLLIPPFSSTLDLSTEKNPPHQETRREQGAPWPPQGLSGGSPQYTPPDQQCSCLTKGLPRAPETHGDWGALAPLPPGSQHETGHPERCRTKHPVSCPLPHGHHPEFLIGDSAHGIGGQGREEVFLTWQSWGPSQTPHPQD